MTILFVTRLSEDEAIGCSFLEHPDRITRLGNPSRQSLSLRKYIGLDLSYAPEQGMSPCQCTELHRKTVL